MRQSGKGFTLLEVLAALLILGVAIFALLQLQGQAISDTTKLKRLARAHAAAESAVDQFFTMPEFVPAGDVFDEDRTITVAGYPEDEFEIHRILSEWIPAEDQDTFYVNPDDEPDEDEMLEEGDLEEPWDPGTFVSVRIEVREPGQNGNLLVALETWLPKPPLEDEEEDTDNSDSSSGESSTSSGSGRSSSGGGRSGGSGDTGGRSGNSGGSGTSSRSGTAGGGGGRSDR